MANEKGVWRTIGGRRVFIKEGQDLASAMKESGKFKSASKISKKDEDDIKKSMQKVAEQYEQDKKEDKVAERLKENEANERKIRSEATGKDKVLEDFKNSDGSKENFEKALNKISEMEYNNEINPDEYKESISKIQKEYVEKNRKANEPIEKRLEKQNRYTESESIKEIKDKYMPERTKAVSQYQNGEIDRNELMKRFDGNEQRMKETFEQMGYTAPTKENIDNANKRHEEFMNNLKGNKEKTTNDIMNEKIRSKGKSKVEEDDLPKRTEIKTQGTSNRKEVSDNIQAHQQKLSLDKWTLWVNQICGELDKELQKVEAI